MNTSIHNLNPVAHIKIVTAALVLAGIAIAVGMLARPAHELKTGPQIVMQAPMPGASRT